MDWQRATLGQLVNVQSGCAFKSKEYCDAGHFLVRIGNVQDGKLNLGKPKYVSLDEKTLRFELNEGDFLLSLTGNIGRVARVEKEHLPAALNQRVARITVTDSSQLSQKFLYQFLSSKFFRNTFLESGHGAAQQNVSPNEISNAQIPLPPLPEQQRIVAILDEAFEGIGAAIANTQQNLANARELFESYLENAFSLGVQEWEKCQLGSIVNRLTNGYVGPTRDIYCDSGIPYLLARHVKNNRLNFDGKTFVSEGFNQKIKKSMLKQGDVLLVQSGHIGHSAVVPETHEGHNCHAMIVITPMDDKTVGDFLSLFFSSPNMREKFQEIRSGSTVPHLTCREVKKLQIPVPSLSTQYQVVKEARAFHKKTSRLEAIYQQKLDALAELKQSILQKAFSGELTSEQAAA